MTKLLDRAEALTLGTGMHWRDAERLALSEVGIDDAAIVELVGECTSLGTESLLTGEEICEFARAVLVHGSALLKTCNAALSAAEAELAEAGHDGTQDDAACRALKIIRAALDA